MNNYEKTLLARCNMHNLKYLAGCDEVGRGAWAGPIVVCSVILPINYYNSEIKDSKLLSERKRECLSKEIINIALDYSFVIVPVSIVEEKNPKQASIYGMELSINSLKIKPQLILLDYEKIRTNINQISIIKGDYYSQTIGAASILAKVKRDQIMIDASVKYPFYHWESNKGYGTKSHQEAISKFGIVKYHRSTYKPIKKYL